MARVLRHGRTLENLMPESLMQAAAAVCPGHKARLHTRRSPEFSRLGTPENDIALWRHAPGFWSGVIFAGPEARRLPHKSNDAGLSVRHHFCCIKKSGRAISRAVHDEPNSLYVHRVPT